LLAALDIMNVVRVPLLTPAIALDSGAALKGELMVNFPSPSVPGSATELPAEPLLPAFPAAPLEPALAPPAEEPAPPVGAEPPLASPPVDTTAPPAPAPPLAAAVPAPPVSAPPVPVPPIAVTAPPAPVPPLGTAAPADPKAPLEAWVPPVPAGKSAEDDPHAPTTVDSKSTYKRLLINIVLAPPAAGLFARWPVETLAPNDRSLQIHITYQSLSAG
jgi:hypothetical protein